MTWIKLTVGRDVQYVNMEHAFSIYGDERGTKILFAVQSRYGKDPSPAEIFADEPLARVMELIQEAGGKVVG